MLWLLIIPCAVLIVFGGYIFAAGVTRFVRSRFASGYYGPERRVRRTLPPITYGERDDS